MHALSYDYTLSGRLCLSSIISLAVSSVYTYSYGTAYLQGNKYMCVTHEQLVSDTRGSYVQLT